MIIFFMLYASACIAQLCTGSLGDPSVNITFGSGPNPGNPLSAATTNYQYTTDPCPVNGYYTIANSGVDCMYGWHILPGDHTGNPSGYYMLVDASFDPSDFYLDTVKNLCPNTTYQFAAWVINMKYVTQGIRPNITFKVETETGSVIQSFTTGDIPVEQEIQWKQYGFYFTTPANMQAVVLRMTNTAPGGDGNDLALDDITFRPCGPVITSKIDGFTEDTVVVCQGDSTVFTFTAEASSAYVNPSYQWQLSRDSGSSWSDIPGALSVSYSRKATGPGDYRYRVAVTDQRYSGNVSCRISSSGVRIIDQARAFVNAGSDRIVFKGDTVHLDGTITGQNVSWYWSPPDYLSDSRSIDPVASPPNDIEYILYGQSIFGCVSIDTVDLKVINAIYVPNAFTPNGDNINDHWHIPYLEPLSGASIMVYNRYGQLVYHAMGRTVDWDGTFKGGEQPSGTYVYHIHFKKGRKDMKGTFQLVR